MFQAIQQRRTPMVKQIEQSKLDIFRVLQLVLFPVQHKTQITVLEKYSYDQIIITLHNKVQIKMLKILERMEDKLILVGQQYINNAT